MSQTWSSCWMLWTLRPLWCTLHTCPAKMHRLCCTVVTIPHAQRFARCFVGSCPFSTSVRLRLPVNAVHAVPLPCCAAQPQFMLSSSVLSSEQVCNARLLTDSVPCHKLLHIVRKQFTLVLHVAMPLCHAPQLQ